MLPTMDFSSVEGKVAIVTGAAIPVDGALAAGHQNVSTWKHPEIME